MEVWTYESVEVHKPYLNLNPRPYVPTFTPPYPSTGKPHAGCGVSFRYAVVTCLLPLMSSSIPLLSKGLGG